MLCLKRIFCGVFALNLVCADNALDLQALKADILKLANDFGKQRANPITSSCFWEQAYTAYVFKKINDNDLSSDELEQIGKIIQSKDSWHDILTGKEVATPFKILSWNDEMLRPYFKEACMHWSKQQASLEKDWQEFASRYVSNRVALTINK